MAASGSVQCPAAAALITIRLSGDFDICALPWLAARIACVQAMSPGRIAFDLTAVRFMDCASARLVVGATGAGGTRPLLIAPRPAIRRLLQVTGLDAGCEISGTCS